MCTVTLTSLAAENGFVLTSSRDEAPGRKTVPPETYFEEGVKMVFPKDILAGGTWLGISEKRRLICLLNGAFEKHDRNPPYRLSRGVVVKHLLAADDFGEAIRDYELQQVEPFTTIVVEWARDLQFMEFVWDGTRKHFRNLPPGPHIWSSSPLYSEEMKGQREQWFSGLQEEKELTPETLLNFHFSAGIGDPEIDVKMDRGFVKTQSVSQLILTEGQAGFYYKDLETGEESILDLKTGNLNI